MSATLSSVCISLDSCAGAPKSALNFITASTSRCRTGEPLSVLCAPTCGHHTLLSLVRCFRTPREPHIIGSVSLRGSRHYHKVIPDTAGSTLFVLVRERRPWSLGLVTLLCSIIVYMTDKKAPSNTSGNNILAPGSRIMGLKFMQRHQAQKVPHSGSTLQSSVAPTATSSSTGPEAKRRDATEWSLETAATGSLSSSVPVIQHESEAEQGDPRSTLIGFRAGRRSFGSFNPRLEK